MRAVQLVKPGQPLRAADVETPEPGRGDVVIRVTAAGICRSDVHYRAGEPQAGPLPLTLGHEIAGVVESVGEGVDSVAVGDRVAVHYQVTCGECRYCMAGAEQFCRSGAMMGKDRDGGYADCVKVPARNAVAVPDEVPDPHAAVMMCSTATSFHALRKARMAPGDTVAVFGVGGLGQSAVQIAAATGAGRVFAIDINPYKLALAARFGATPIDARTADPIAELHAAGGADVALELIGIPETFRQAVASLAVHGRVVAVGLNQGPVPIFPYRELITREAEVLGAADHLAGELPVLLGMAARGVLDLSDVVTHRIDLDETAVNGAMDRLESFGDSVRTVIVP